MDKNNLSISKKTVFSYWGLFILFFVFLISLVILLLVLPSTFAANVTMEVYSQADGKAFGQDVEMNIFNDPNLEDQRLVHPYSKGCFSFDVYNNSDSQLLSYYIELLSDNPNQVPLAFSLQRNGEYVFGGSKESEMEEIDHETLETIYLSGKTTDMYTLKWQWKTESDEKDTLIGDGPDQFYKLTLRAVGTQHDVEIPQTGDNSRLCVLIIIAVISLIIIVLVRCREKKEEDVDLQEDF